MKKLLAAIFMLIFAGLGYFFFGKLSKAHPLPRSVSVARRSPALLSEPRPVYPRSIVPGGIRTIEELKRAMFNDVVARNFSGFNLPEARFERLTQPECAYVSFRRRNRVAWTRHCVRLSEGELILTDGRLRFRAKCANRISAKKQAPTATVDVTQMEIPLPDDVPAPLALPVTIAPPLPSGPGGTPVVAPPPPSAPVCCDTPIGGSPFVPVGGPPIGGAPRSSLDAGDDWKVAAAPGILLLVALSRRRHSV